MIWWYWYEVDFLRRGFLNGLIDNVFYIGYCFFGIFIVNYSIVWYNYGSISLKYNNLYFLIEFFVFGS